MKRLILELDALSKKSAYSVRESLVNLVATLDADVPEEAVSLKRVNVALKSGTDKDLRSAAQFAVEKLSDSSGSIAIAIVDVETALGTQTDAAK